MVKQRRELTKKSHIFIFGTLFIFMLSFISAKMALSVQLDPANLIVHTNLVYYDGQFSAKTLTEDLHTAVYVLNQSNEYIYASVFEYDRNKREVKTAVQIGPNQNQFIKTDGPGVVYLTNAEGTASSTVKFSRWYTIKKYTIPAGFKF